MTSRVASIAFACCVAARALFLLTSPFLFVPRTGFSPRLRALALWAMASSATEILSVYRATPAPLLAAGAIALYLVSLTLFMWTAAAHRGYRPSPIYSTDVPSRVVTEGPYRFVRHPYYTAYLLAHFAAVLATHGAIVVILLCGTNVVLYTRAALAEEGAFRSSASRDAYETYCSRTGRFIPRIGRS